MLNLIPPLKKKVILFKWFQILKYNNTAPAKNKSNTTINKNNNIPVTTNNINTTDNTNKNKNSAQNTKA